MTKALAASLLLLLSASLGPSGAGAKSCRNGQECLIVGSDDLSPDQLVEAMEDCPKVKGNYEVFDLARVRGRDRSLLRLGVEDEDEDDDEDEDEGRRLGGCGRWCMCNPPCDPPITICSGGTCIGGDRMLAESEEAEESRRLKSTCEKLVECNANIYCYPCPEETE